jgi:hypothetical protein|nr:MAG TPA: hypothetical protein [Caudoviricetes sp.]
MPITNGKYVNPGWKDNAPPPLNAAELNAISDSIVGAEKNIEDINEMGNYKVGDVFITSRTDLDSTWTLANGQLVTNNNSFYELQHKVWLPMDSEISYSGQNFGFSVIPYVYRIESQGTSNQNLSINVSKYLSTSRQETRQLVAPRAVQMQSWQNNKQEFCWGYFGGKYVWVVGTFGSTLSPMYSVYVCYTDTVDDLSSWKCVQLPTDAIDNMTTLYLNLQYINGTYIVTTVQYENSVNTVRPLYMWWSTDCVSWNFKKITPNITGGNYITSSAICYYQGNYWSFVTWSNKNETWVSKASTLSGLGTYSSWANSRVVANYANFPVSEDSVCYLDGNQIKLNCCDESFRIFNVNLTVGYIYNLDNYIVVGGNQSNNGDNVYVFLKKPGTGANSLQQVLNRQYTTTAFHAVTILGHPMEGVLYNAKLSAPCLPEISLKNTYAYVKTSSTPT